VSRGCALVYTPRACCVDAWIDRYLHVLIGWRQGRVIAHAHAIPYPIPYVIPYPVPYVVSYVIVYGLGLRGGLRGGLRRAGGRQGGEVWFQCIIVAVAVAGGLIEEQVQEVCVIIRGFLHSVKSPVDYRLR